MSRRTVSEAMVRFAGEVGPDDAVAAVGGGSAGDLGGALDEGTRRVAAPRGVIEVVPDELVVRVGAGTPIGELEASLAEVGQGTVLASASGATVGGVLATGRSGVLARGQGPLRDALLEACTVDAWGRVMVAGGPTVKNVSGFDLCRLLVGSLGTLALIGEVVLRTRPLPPAERWMSGPADRGGLGAVLAASGEPTAALWDGGRMWLHLAGHASDVERTAGRLGALGFTDTDGPPALPPRRSGCPPSHLLRDGLPRGRGRVVAELGVGVLHCEDPGPPPVVAPRLAELHRAVKSRFDPEGRLAPGRCPLNGAGVGA